jgi:hypothetical protein
MRLSGTKTSTISTSRGLGNQLYDLAGERPSLDLQFSDQKSLVDAATGSQPVTFTRASSGTYVDSQGVIRTATTNEARFDHNPTTGESLGLLVEEQRTNLILNSEDFSQNQATNSVSISTNQTIAPDGTSTADLVTATLASTSNTCWVQNIATIAPSTATYTMSCFVKQGTSPSVSFNIAMNGGTYIEAFANFNFSTKAIGIGGGGAASATAGYQQLGNGWFRLWLSLPNNNTGTGVTHRVYTRSEGSTNAVGDSVYLWGRQLEAGAFPTSYIPTTTAAVTRSADVASITGSNWSSWGSSTTGTYYLEASVTRSSASAAKVFLGTSTSPAESYYLYQVQNQNDLRTFDSTTVLDTVNVISDGITFKGGIAYSSADSMRSLVLDGGAVVEGAFDGTYGTDLSIGSRIAGGAPTTGTIRRLTYWPQRLPNSTLQQITQ